MLHAGDRFRRKASSGNAPPLPKPRVTRPRSGCPSYQAALSTTWTRTATPLHATLLLIHTPPSSISATWAGTPSWLSLCRLLRATPPAPAYRPLNTRMQEHSSPIGARACQHLLTTQVMVPEMTMVSWSFPPAASVMSSSSAFFAWLLNRRLLVPNRSKLSVSPLPGALLLLAVLAV